MRKWIAQLVNILLIIIGVLWYVFDPGWEPIVFSLATLGTLLLQIFFPQKAQSIINVFVDNEEDSNNPGFGIGLVIKLNFESKDSRKFIIDFGDDENRNRVSLYLDSRNNLIFRVLDDQGESHTLKTVPSMLTFQDNSFFHLYADIGEKAQIILLRLIINGKEVARSEMSNEIELPRELDKNKMIIGTDMSKTYFTKFTLNTLTTFHTTITMNNLIPHVRNVEKLNKNLAKERSDK